MKPRVNEGRLADWHVNATLGKFLIENLKAFGLRKLVTGVVVMLLTSFNTVERLAVNIICSFAIFINKKRELFRLPLNPFPGSVLFDGFRLH
jgi:hypothetical protein